MRVLLLHNFYAQPGGEDAVFFAETGLLRSHGIAVEQFAASNGDVVGRGRLATARTLWRAGFNRKVFEEVRVVCGRLRPDVAHVHNFWFSLSPSVHAACHAEGVPTVQTLHNFRLMCVNAILMNDGQTCERCIGRGPWPGVIRRCYRNSIAQSAAVARMIAKNRKRGTWENDVDLFVVLTEFNRQIFLRAGFPQKRIGVKPNFMEDPGAAGPPGNGAVFIGRLSREKGVRTLLAAWSGLTDTRLKIFGDGPLSTELQEAGRNKRLENVEFMGQQPTGTCLQGLRDAAFLVMPSEWYEGFPRTLVEAFALGRPVVASRLGSLAELVADGRTGLLFEPGNADDLAAKVQWMVEHPEACRDMGLAARREYEEKYTPERNYEMVMNIYETAIRNFRNR